MAIQFQRKLLSLTYLFLLLPFTAFCSPVEKVTNKHEVSPESEKHSPLFSTIQGYLNDGKVVIVAGINSGRDTEQFGDWYQYLGDFLETNRAYVFVEATEEFESKFLKKFHTGAPLDGYSFFLDQSLKGYFYPGVVLEPMVYISVDEYLFKKEKSSFAPAFIPQEIEFSL